MFKATASPVAKLSVPSSVSVTFSPIATLAPAATLSVPAAPTVTGPPNVELPAPSAIEPLVMFRVARSSRLAIIGSAVACVWVTVMPE